MEEDFKEYIIFTVNAKDGRELEMAVVDEFEMDGTNYVAASLVEDDTINEDELYIYRVKKNTTEFVAEMITDPKEYEAAATAYSEMEMTNRFA